MKLAVTAVHRDFETHEPVPPCGGCRQVIKEFEDLSKRKIIILFSGWNGQVARVEGIDSLLPMGFGPTDLQIDIDRNT